MKTSDLFEAAVACLVEHDEYYGPIYWGCCSSIEIAACDLDVSDERQEYVEDMFYAMYEDAERSGAGGYWWGYPCAENLQERIIALTLAAEYMRLCGD